MDSLQKRIGELSSDQFQLLEKLLKDDSVPVSNLGILPRNTTSNTLPLSYAQERLWFLDQLAPGNPFYNENANWRVKGSLNAAALHQSINEIVRRHESLRTTFQTIDGKPVQVIAQTLSLPLPIIDLCDLPKLERQAEALRLATEEAQQRFDLVCGPLIRTALIRLEEEDHIFLVTMHHIVTDGWSIGLFFQELHALYAAFSLGHPSPLPDLPIQYADFAIWQRRWLTGEVIEAQLAYWRQQLVDLPSLQLPTDRPRPALPNFQGAQHSVVFPRWLSSALKELSQRERVTLFMTLLAAFQTLLHRYTGQDDIVVGSPIANRDRPEMSGLIGFFVNTLVMRTDFSGDPSFRELLSRVRQVALGAYAHQDLPFEKLVEKLQPERNLSRNPLFQVILQVLNGAETIQEPPGATSFLVESGTAKFDLRLDLADSPQGLKAQWEYSTDLFDAMTMSRMAGHFQTLLEGIIANPQQRLSELPLLTEAERCQLLVEWNKTAGNYPRNSCIHELFEAQAERTPEALAVVFGEKHLTYGALNRRANQLARYLQGQGVGPEVLVGVCLERSVEMVVGLLAILKAGAAYLPLDPAYPRERLSFMLQDGQARVLLTKGHPLVGWTDAGIAVINLEALQPEIDRQSEQNLATQTTAENLAYIMYTSGSTGRPKGVSIPHRGVVRLVVDTDYATLDGSDRVAQASNCAFDAATFEIWGALLHGARLVGISKEVMLSPPNFSAQIQEQEISVLFLTTDLFNQLVSEQPGAFRSVRHLLFGGSAVDPRRVREVLQHGPPQRLLHVYGPTESTTFASWYLVEEVTEEATTIPIGHPIANTQIYLLDRHLNPVPTGVQGELYIGGDGLARGYWNQPKLTAEKFLVNPFSDEPGARLYRTGDLARYRPDGNIEFLGRLDDQVKIRGFRIELAEIEAVLHQHPSVAEAVVLAREDKPGDRRLVTYVVQSKKNQSESAGRVDLTAQQGKVYDEVIDEEINREASLDPPFNTSGGNSPQRREQNLIPTLRSFLQERVPEYMIPAAFVLLEALPRNPNGKVDRNALPVPDQVRPELEGGYLAPRTPVEELLAGMWAQLLGLEQVGVEDNFFDLGGHSLLATQVISRVRNFFKVELPLRELFERPTIAGLAHSITERQAQEQGHPMKMDESISRLTRQDASVDLDGLSDDEVDSMLKGLLAKGEAT